MKVRSEFNMAGFTRLCRELEAGAQEAAHEAALDYGRIFTKAVSYTHLTLPTIA